MNCFEHPQKPAHGTCTFCGRGLCRDCATVVQGKLSCRGKCEQEVARERQLLQKSERAMDQRSVVYETSGNMYHQAFAITAFFGLAFVFLGALAHDLSHSLLDTGTTTPEALNPINRINQKLLAWLSLVLYLISGACGLSLVYNHWTGSGFAGCLALTVAIMFYLEVRLIRHPCAETAKPFYIFGFLFFLLPIIGHVVDLAI